MKVQEVTKLDAHMMCEKNVCNKVKNKLKIPKK